MKITLGLNMEEMNYCVKYFERVVNNIEFIIKMKEKAYLINEVDVDVIYVLKACEEILKNLREYNTVFEVNDLYCNHLIEWLGIQTTEDTMALFKNYTTIMAKLIDDAIYSLYCDISD